MVAKEPPRYSPPYHHVAASTKSLTFGSPKLAVKTTSCNLICGMQWGARSYPLSRHYYSKSGLSTPPSSKVTGTLPSPTLLPNPSLFSLASKPSSINVIQSYRNYLFGMSASASVRGLSLAIPLLKTTIGMDCPPYKLNEPSSKSWPPATLEGRSQNNNQEGSCMTTNLLESVKSSGGVGIQTGPKLPSNKCESLLAVDTIFGHQNPTMQCHPGNQEAIKVMTCTNKLWANEGNSTDSYQSDDSQYEHSEYGSDNDDDFIQFSDESLPDECVIGNNLTLPCVQFMSISSSESGYFECTGDSVFPNTDSVHDDQQDHVDDDGWSDSCSEGPQDEPCLDIWNEFETQALSPMMICHRQYPSLKSPSLCYESPVEDNNKATTVRGDSHMICLETACESDNEPSNKASMNDKDAVQVQADGCIIPNKSRNRVRFKPDSELEEVHMIIAWNYAYRASRRGPWEQYARDRTRFRRRIDCVASVLEPCLSAKLERVCGACK